MPNIGELISRTSRRTTEGEGEILAPKLDFGYAYGQIKLDERTGRYPNIFPRRNRRNPGKQKPGMARRHNI